MAHNGCHCPHCGADVTQAPTGVAQAGPFPFGLDLLLSLLKRFVPSAAFPRVLQEMIDLKVAAGQAPDTGGVVALGDTHARKKNWTVNAVVTGDHTH